MKIAIIDARMPDAARRQLMLEGFCIIETKPARGLSPALAYHPDMLIFKDGKTLITSADYAEGTMEIFEDLTRLIPSLRIIMTADSFYEKYPRDAIFNALIVGDKLFAKCDTVSGAVLDYAKSCGLDIINVRQGYPACTVLPLPGKRAITADMGMARVLMENGIEVTLIENGAILLPPHEYGFIGGASGIYKNKLYFIGDFTKHPSRVKIEEAVKESGLIPVCLFDGMLTDLGRILFFDDDVENNSQKRG